MPAPLLKKETLEQAFSCEICEIFKSTIFIEHLCATASEWMPLYNTVVTIMRTAKQVSTIIEIFGSRPFKGSRSEVLS